MKKNFRWLICLFIGLSFAIPTPGLCQDYYDGIIDSPPAAKEKKAEPVVVAPKYPLVEILATVDRTKFVGEQNLVLRAEIAFYQQVNPFWEELAKINFSPFILEKIILGERKIFDREKELTRDYKAITFLLSLPSDSKCGSYTIPSFSLNYSDLQGKMKGTVKSKAIKVEKVPILVTVAMDKDAITIGENNVIRLTIWREKFIRLLNQEIKDQSGESQALEDEGFQRWLKSLEVRNQKITNLKKPDFPGFKILDKKFYAEQQNSTVMEVFEYLFAFYELGGKEFPLPKFHIWYLNRSEDKDQKSKEVVTPSLSIQINSIVRPGRKTIEWLKPPEPNRKNNIYYFGYGPMVLGGLLFLIFGTNTLLGIIRGRRKHDISAEIRESPSKILLSLSNLQRAAIIDRRLIVQIRNELSKMLCGIVKIPTTYAQAKTGKEIAQEFIRGGFPESLTQKIENCFRLCDQIMMQNDRSETYTEMWTQINEITDHQKISKFLKKKKKFLIF